MHPQLKQRELPERYSFCFRFFVTQCFLCKLHHSLPRKCFLLLKQVQREEFSTFSTKKSKTKQKQKGHSMSCSSSSVLFVQITVWEGHDPQRYTQTWHTTEKSTCRSETEKQKERETERIQVVNTPIHVSLNIHSLGYDNTVLTMLIRGAYILVLL